MGKTKIKTIDDSAEVVEKSSKKKSGKSEEKAKEAMKLESAENVAQPDVVLEGAKRPIESDQKDAIASLQHDKKEDKKTLKPGKAKPRSKKYLEVSSGLDKTKSYSLLEALDKVKTLSYAKFNATLDISINTVQTGLRGFVSLPYASGKKLRILIFAPSQPQLEGVIFGSDSTIEEISQGKVDFDLIISTPDWMPKLAKVAKTLGPRGLMPNPKNNTIASGEDGIKKAVASFQAGKTEYKTEPKAPVIHLALGKLNQPNNELAENIKMLIQTIGKTRIKKITLSPTMGPSVKLNLTSL